MSLADAFVEVVPDLRNFGPALRRGLNRVRVGSAEGAAAGRDYAQGFGSGIMRYGGRAVLGLTAALGTATGAAGLLGIKTAAANENAQIAFTTMLKSGEKAQGFLKQLQDFAAKTPFEFGELQTAASSLISIGIQADKVIPIMTTLGNVTSGMGTGSEGVKRATVALQQMNAAGRITAEDLNQLRDAGIPVFDLLAGATGKSKKELAAMAQNGKLGRKELEQLMKALETGKGLERFSGLMEKQSASLGGLWSTFKDVFSQGMAKAIEPLIPLLKDGLDAAARSLSSILPKVAEGLKTAVTWTVNLVKEWKNGEGAGGRLRSIFEGVRDAVGAVVGWFVKYQDVIVPVLAGIGAMIVAFKVWKAVVTAYTVVQWALNAALTANPIGLVILAIVGLVAGLVVAYKKSETFRNIVNAVWKAVKGAIKATVDWFKDTAWPWMKRVIDRIVASFNEAKREVVAAWDWMKAKIKAGWDWINDKVFDPFKRGLGLLKSQFNTVKEGIGRVWDGLKEKAKAPIRFVINTVLNGGLIKGFNWLSDKIGGPHVDPIKIPGFAAGGVVPGWSPGRDNHRFVSATGGVLDLAGGEAVMVPEFTRAMGGKPGIARLNRLARGMASGGVIDWLKDKGAAAVSWVTSKAGKVWDAVTHPLDYLKNLIPTIPGASTVRDFAAGATSRLLKAAVAKVQSLFRAVQRGVTSLFGSGEGGGASYGAGWGNTLGRVRALLIPGAVITSTYRSPAHNAAVGGSPTSKHMDRLNPAVDIGGPTSVLDRLYPILKNANHWRQLFWRVPGHYDHIHVADTGAMLRPGALGLNLSGRNERVLSPSQTEAFERLVTLLETGGGSGPRTLVIVDKDGDLIGRMRVEAGDVLDEEMAAARWAGGD